MKIEIILGCMYSGKSTELLRRVNRWKSIGKEVLLINHVNDTRTKNSVQTHSNLVQNALKKQKLLCTNKTHDGNIEYYSNFDVIGIDEGQFYPDLYEFVLKLEKYCLENKKNLTLIISGLDGDWERKPIGDILSIIPLCDEVVKLKALDMISNDGSEAIFSKRIVSSNEQILIGANESYKAVSRKNYLA